MSLKVTRIVTGPLQENCYIVQQNHNALIIDPGSDGHKIKEYIFNHSLTPRAILLTHAHFDHIGAVEELRRDYHIPVYMNELEEEWLNNPELNLSSQMERQPVICQPAEFNLTINHCSRCLGDIAFEMIPTPGHTIGGTCYLFDDFIMTGDTLFKHSIGRCDFPSGNYDELINSIKTKLFTLDDSLTIYPGHGEASTIGEEKQNNPFIK